MSKNCPKFFVQKYIKVLEFWKNSKTFLNKGIKHKKNYMEVLNLKNKNIKVCEGNNFMNVYN